MNTDLSSPGWQRAKTVAAVLFAVGLVTLYVYLEFFDDKQADKKAAPTASSSPQPVAGGGQAPPVSLGSTGGAQPPPTPTPSSTRYEGYGVDESPAPGAREAAEGFGRALTNAQGGQKAWYNRLVAFVNPHLAELYKSVPIERAPTGSLLRVDLNQQAVMVAEARLTYDSGLVVDIKLAFNAVKWEVVSVVDRAIPGTSPEGAR